MKYVLPLCVLLAACAEQVAAPDAALDARYQADMAEIAQVFEGQGEETALPLLQGRAEAGNRYAQMRLAELYLQRSPPDWDAARPWLEKAARQDYAPAQFQLALVSDAQTAEMWLRRAAEQDFAPAQARLAELRGLHGQTTDARNWYAQAATQGDAVAQYHLGRELLRDGATEQALRWLTLAAQQGNGDAQFELGMAFLAQGDRERGTAWLQQAESRGHEGARRALRR